MQRPRSAFRLTLCALGLLSVASAAPAPSQVDQTWGFELEAPPGATRLAERLKPLADGGLLVATTYAAPGGAAPVSVLVERFSKDGDSAWQTEIPSASISDERLFAANSSGRSALVLDEGNNPRVVGIAPDGAIAFDEILPVAAQSNFRKFQSIVEVTESGLAVLLANETVSVTDRMILRHIGTDGVVTSLRELPALGTAVASRAIGMKVVGDDAFVCVKEFDPAVSPNRRVLKLRRIDASGAIMWVRTINPSTPSSLDVRLRSINVNESGTSVVHYNGQFERRAVVTDAVGMAVIDVDADGAERTVQINEAGELYQNLPSGLRKISATGAVLWSKSFSNGFAQRSLTLDPAERPIMVGSIDTFLFSVPVFSGLDPETGDIAWSWALPPSLSPMETGRMESNDRGEMFIYGSTSFALDSVFKLLPLSRISDPLCIAPIPNATGRPGKLIALGSNDASDGSLTLMASDLPAGQACMFLTSQTTTPNSVPMPLFGSSGLLCLGGALGRFVAPGEIRFSNGHGTATLQVDTTAIPVGSAATPILSGQTWHFQAWHREPPLASAPSNLTEAVSVSF